MAETLKEEIDHWVEDLMRKPDWAVGDTDPLTGRVVTEEMLRLAKKPPLWDLTCADIVRWSTRN